MRYLLLTLIALASVGCTDSAAARKALEGAGYTKIEITGYSYFGCSDSDTFHTGFEAIGPTGIPVEGVVCSGWFKGATIRSR